MDSTHIHRSAKMLALLLLLAYVAVSHSGCATMAQAYASPRGKDAGSAIAAKPETVYGMAKLLIAQGNEEQGERMLFSLTLTHPKFTPAYNDLAEIRMGQGRIDEAVRFLSSGLEVSEHDPVLLNNLGVCSLMKGEYEDALESFKRVGVAFPYDERVGANTAAALALLGNKDESLALYKKFMSEDDAEFNLEVLTQMRRNAGLIAPYYFSEILIVDLENPMNAMQVIEPTDTGPIPSFDPTSGS